MVPEKGSEGRAPDLQASWRALPAALHCLKKVLCGGARVSRIWVIMLYSKTIDYCDSAKPQFNFQKKDVSCNGRGRAGYRFVRKRHFIGGLSINVSKPDVIFRLEQGEEPWTVEEFSGQNYS
ncbi:hypothetical protein DBR06_SOUSAS5010131, partial [Sousa chinensis]